MVEFGKHLKKPMDHRPTDPVELYDRLDRLSDTGPLRPAQEHVLTEWHQNRRRERDIIVKLHTGQGKTVVGLLMLQSRLNEGVGSSLYLCPNRFLVGQTCLQAQRFGIPVSNGNEVDELPTAFLDGQQIYVCTVQKLFNGLTKFGLKAESIPVGTLLMDDCHACIDSIKEACSISLNAKTPAYMELLALFAPDLRDQGAGTFGDIESGSYDAMLPVPYWAWIDRRDEVTRALGNHRKVDGLKFVWPVLRDMLDKCCCVVSGHCIEISPFVPPLQQFGSYFSAKHRIFMSATVTDDSFLVKGLRLASDTISKPINFPKERWFGEKMILIPSLFDNDTTRESVVSCLAQPVNKRQFGVVALCPSKKAAELWSSNGAKVAEKGTIVDAVRDLLEGNYDQTLCVVNRYDGMDLPDKLCRVLVLDSKPFTGGIVDKYLESCRPSSEFTAQRTARMIEQGIGRGVRGEKDYCAVVLVGGDLVRAVQRTDVKVFYSSQTRRQIEIGAEIAQISKDEVAHGVSAVEITISCINKLLSRDAGWKDFYADRMSEVKLETPNPGMLKLYALELQAETMAEDGRYVDARNLIQAMLDNSPQMPREDLGWYKQEMARLLYRQSKAESATLQNVAHKQNPYLLKPKDGVVFKKLELRSQHRVQNIIAWVQQSRDYDELLIEVQSILGNLRFGVESDAFEAAIDALGRAIGFAAERPDKSWGRGPDNLWCIKKDSFLLIECKNEVKLQRDEIYKTESGQMNNSFAWFTENYPSAKAECVMVISTRKVSAAAGFNMSVSVIREGNLKKLERSVHQFFQEFSAVDLKDLDPGAVQKWLITHNLETDSLIQNFTEPVHKY